MTMRWHLKQLLVETFGSQWRASLALEIHESTLSKIVTGRLSPSPEQRAAIAEAVGVMQRVR